MRRLVTVHTLLYKQSLPLDLRYSMFAGSPAARAACWSNDLIRFALITVLLVTIYGSIKRQREGGQGEGVIVSGTVSLSSCQEQCLYCTFVLS